MRDVMFFSPITSHDVLEPLKQALLVASRDVLISGQIGCSKSQRVFQVTDHGPTSLKKPRLTQTLGLSSSWGTQALERRKRVSKGPCCSFSNVQSVEAK